MEKQRSSWQETLLSQMPISALDFEHVVPKEHLSDPAWHSHNFLELLTLYWTANWEHLHYSTSVPSPSPQQSPQRRIARRGASRLRGSKLGQFKSPLKREQDQTTDDKQKAPQSNKKVRVDTDQGGAKKLSFEEEKKRLERAIAMKVKRVEELERKEQLAHKQFNDEEQQKVDKLIVKWREVCQTVTQDLYARCVADMPDLTIPQLLEHVQIEPQLIHYSVAEETFY